MPPDVLDLRTLNRALLERQMLMRRRRVPVADALERLVALQAQVPIDPYVALWSRLDRFRPASLSELLERREAIRMGLLRATLHLVTASDAVPLRPVIEPVLQRGFRASPFHRRLAGIDLEQLVAVATELVEERPRTRAELGPLLAERWPEFDPTDLSYVTFLLPLVQVTPRGLWGRSGPSSFTTLRAWLGRAPGTSDAPDELVLRYLAAYGPATVGDAQAWSGLAGLRPVFERLGPRLRTFRDGRGRVLYDVPGAPIPDPATPAPVRFLPQYDNVFLAHADRTRIVAEEVRTRMFTVGWGQVLVDGFIAARWTLERADHAATLIVQPYGQLARRDRSAVGDEADRLVAFLAEDADRRAVRFRRWLDETATTSRAPDTRRSSSPPRRPAPG